MSERLTAESGEDQLTLWPEGFRAKTSAPPARGRASSTALVLDSGERCDASSKSADPVGCSLRTYLLSELAGLTPFSLIWKRSATPAGRSWWVLGRSGHRTSEIACGSLGDWSTPTTLTGGGNPRPNNPHDAGALHWQVRQYWQTPKVQYSQRSPEAHEAAKQRARKKYEMGEYAKGCGCPSMNDLQIQVMQMWPTPNANDAARGADTSAMKKSRGAGGPNLLGAIQDWPTPTCAEADKIGGRPNYGQLGLNNHPAIRGERTREKGEKSRGLQDQEIRSTDGKSRGSSDSWPTPKASDGRAKGNGGDRKSPGLQQAMTTKGKVLNAKWVAQLMGYPPDWCDLPSDTTASLFARSATPSSPPSSRRSGGGS